jgi:hypothetical protein
MQRVSQDNERRSVDEVVDVESRSNSYIMGLRYFYPSAEFA